MKKTLRVALAVLFIAATLLIQTGCASAYVISDGGSLGDFFNAASQDFFGAPEQNCREITVSLPRHAGYEVLTDKTAYATLTSTAQQQAYESIESAIFAVSDEWSEKYGGYAMRYAPVPNLTSTEIFIVKEAVLADHPEAFWLTGKYSISANMHDGCYITLYSAYDYSDISSCLLALERSMIAIFREIPSNRSEYERELAIHNILVGSVEYAIEAVDTAVVGTSVSTAYGALVEGRAVCSGYSKAFKLLCNRLGLSCRTVNGQSMGVGHMWNLVRIDGSWYHVDVTWDDPVTSNSNSDRISYDYFNLTDEWIALDHDIAVGYDQLDRLISDDPSYSSTVFCNFNMPECTAVRYNFYKRNAVKVDSLNDDGADLLYELVAECRANSRDCIYLEFPEEMEQQVILDWLEPTLIEGCVRANALYYTDGLPTIELCERIVRDSTRPTAWSSIYVVRLVYTAL